MFDERAKRNPEFDERNSTWITLADGGRWAFPKPWLEIHATFRDGRAVASYPVLTYGPDLEELVHAIDQCRDNAALLVGAASLGRLSCSVGITNSRTRISTGSSRSASETHHRGNGRRP